MAKPKLALIPSGVADNQVFSVLPSNGDGDFNFTRGTVATRVNAQGLIETVSNDLPRLNYPLLDGVVQECPSLLLEDSATNLVTYSEDLTSWSKVVSSVSYLDNVINPSGKTFTSKITQTSSGGYVQISRTFTGVETFSAFVKKSSSDFVRFYAGGQSVYFNIINGTVETISGSVEDKSITDFGNGWFRISITVNSTSSSSVRIYPASSGSSTSGTNSLFVYGAQLEVESYPTSYIPTNGSTVTRLAETCNGAGTSDTFNDSEGVLMVEMSALANDGTNRYITLSDSAISNRVNIFFDASNNLRGFVNGISSISSGVAIQGNNKCAFKYKSGDIAFWVNGIEVGTRTATLSLTGLSQISFKLAPGTNVFYGNTKQLQYFDTALTDNELEQLTSWTSFQDMAQSQLYSIQ